MEGSAVVDRAAEARAALVAARNVVEEARHNPATLQHPRQRQRTPEEEAVGKENYRRWCADSAQWEFETLPEHLRTGPIIDALVDLCFGHYNRDVDRLSTTSALDRGNGAFEELLDAAVSCAEAEAAQASVDTSALVEAALAYGRTVLELRRFDALSDENRQQMEQAADRIKRLCGREYAEQARLRFGLVLPECFKALQEEGIEHGRDTGHE